MAADNFGAFKKVSVRQHWPNEQRDFTPWLAGEENIKLLGDAIGLELEVESTEVSVGPYSADILARDSGSDRYVVIENQFGKTNHDHLGKLLTYAAALDAASVVWIAEEFTDEHRKALDWLNDHSSESVSFFGVVLELWKIDDSRPAVRFNVISNPNETARQAAVSKGGEQLTDATRMQLEFWTSFRDQLVADKILTSPQTPRPQYWFDVPLGKSGIHLSNIADTFGGRIGVRVYISNRIASEALPQLESQKLEIEKEIGQQLEWNPRPENRDKVIAISKPVDFKRRGEWPEYVSWMAEMTKRFRHSFMPRIKRLKLSSNASVQESPNERETTLQDREYHRFKNCMLPTDTLEEWKKQVAKK